MKDFLNQTNNRQTTTLILNGTTYVFTSRKENIVLLKLKNTPIKMEFCKESWLNRASREQRNFLRRIEQDVKFPCRLDCFTCRSNYWYPGRSRTKTARRLEERYHPLHDSHRYNHYVNIQICKEYVIFITIYHSHQSYTVKLLAPNIRHQKWCEHV